MKKRVWILRHGEAERETLRDSDRRLTDRGMSDASAVGEWLATISTPALKIFASPYTRAQQTAKQAAVALPNKSIATVSWLTPDIDPAEAVAAIDKLEFSELLLVSHQPLVSALIGVFVANDYRAGAPMATASLAELEMNIVAADCAVLASLRHAPDYSVKATY